MVPFQHIEGAAIDLDAADDPGNKDIGIGVTVAVRVGGKIIRDQVASDQNILSDGLAVISGHARSKILWRFDST